MKIFNGRVISTKMAKTATVEVVRLMAHPIYGKRVKRVTKYHVHDENSTAKVGDVVKFIASRPYSKLKKWALLAEKSQETKTKKQTVKKEVKKVIKKVKAKK